jgi:DNA-directed RNA polymerase specialized sigma24 family protein
MMHNAKEGDSEQRMIRRRMLEKIFGASVGVLGDLGRCSLAEIARAMKIPRGTVYRRIFDARRQHERAKRRKGS